MAETANIARMAEVLAKDVFSRFLWTPVGGLNQNWACLKSEQHQRATHPSDVVLFYDEPYSVRRTYVNCDLKSYSRPSITLGAVATALQSLALALSCAEVSDEWRKMYMHEGKTPDVIGLLFIYNHDGEYDKDFDRILTALKNEKLAIPKGSRIFILGPRDIQWLDNVRYELTYMRGIGEIPSETLCRFYYPELVRKKKVQPRLARAATLEMLKGPWIILEYDQTPGRKAGYVVFYKRRGESAEEFLYLIDYLMHYQRVNENFDITIRTLDPDPNAAAHFSRAVNEFIEVYEGEEEIALLLRAIKYQRINSVHTSFSDVDLGML